MHAAGRFLVILVAGAGAGMLAGAAGIPGGLIFGSVVGAAAAGLVTGWEITVPPWLANLVLICVGAQIGMRVTRDTVQLLGGQLLPATAAALVLIAGGLGITWILRRTGRSPRGDVLATSPGALEVLIAIAVERNYGAGQVAVFHLVRILLVVASVPLLLYLFPP
ncbi:AbrB family transcriptional regulator [Blastococcus colisei]|uniref:AbrB family transcriptional regulator n=1 Tax=Blastococcus colisei TaxID=1564162 RepID=UPI001FE5E566|nr:AbrB family transcriptional regulator [Blastococcus colisei]